MFDRARGKFNKWVDARVEGLYHQQLVRRRCRAMLLSEHDAVLVFLRDHAAPVYFQAFVHNPNQLNCILGAAAERVMTDPTGETGMRFALQDVVSPSMPNLAAALDNTFAKLPLKIPTVPKRPSENV